ncbi:hypothetical protein [Mycobacterium sp. NAZ190054]|uniref:hypothetical protein n=1 Tax=Mycobacterium sp. NAZ190054 TaxID=1747766 RepID=UPI0007913A21|nr:hypothetical protein [Mycobacterium sp. NAZ190054]KWX65476.1 hypothetical protein ASJ79_28885 [Mycobacterium sp. NAZ190054]
MDSGAGQDPDPDVRRALERLGNDPDSAPEVPADVTARIAASLREASRTGAHTLSRPTLTRRQRAGLAAGVTAVTAGLVVGAVMLVRDPGPVFPTGPTASLITVAGHADGFPLPDAELRALLGTAPDLGPLTDPRRRGSCLAGLGYAPTLEILGGRRLEISGQPAVVLLLPGATPAEISAVAVPAACDAARTAVLAETVVARP